MKNLSDCLQQNLIILIDIGVFNEDEEYIQIITNLIVRCARSKLVVAISSGQGHFYKQKSHQDLICRVSKYEKCRILNFTKEEALFYISKLRELNGKQNIVDVEKLQTLTSFNPFLLSLYAIDESNYTSLSVSYMHKYILSILEDMEKFSRLSYFYKNDLKAIYDWGCKAENGILCPIHTLNEFKSSSAARQNFMFYEQINKDSFLVHCALPCLQMLLSEVVHKYQETGSLPDVPILHGFIYEHEFFTKLQTSMRFTVTKGSKCETYRVDRVSDRDNDVQIVVGTLYHCKYTYPVIDGLGYLKIDAADRHVSEVTLCFIQVSLSKYAEHRTKLNDLNTHNPPEDSSKNILQYYKGLVPRGYKIKETVYIYVSPHNAKKQKKNAKAEHHETAVQYAEMFLQYV